MYRSKKIIEKKNWNQNEILVWDRRGCFLSFSYSCVIAIIWKSVRPYLLRFMSNKQKNPFLFFLFCSQLTLSCKCIFWSILPIFYINLRARTSTCFVKRRIFNKGVTQTDKSTCLGTSQRLILITNIFTSLDSLKFRSGCCKYFENKHIHPRLLVDYITIKKEGYIPAKTIFEYFPFIFNIIYKIAPSFLQWETDYVPLWNLSIHTYIKLSQALIFQYSCYYYYYFVFI